LAPITQFTCSTTRINLTAQSQLGALASFVWSTGSSATIITATTAGVYQVTATNGSNFCTSVTAVTLTSNTTPPAIVFTSGIRELNCSIRTLNIDASTSTGQGALGYNWSNGQAANNINVTRPGVIALTLTDATNGCTTTANQTVTENVQAPTSVITPSATVITCRTPLIELNANSSSPINTLSFLWSVNNDSRPTITIGNAGVYQLLVTNSLNGCTATSNQTITTVPNTLQASTSTTPALCNGGSTGTATVNTTGGAAPISYLWSTSQNTVSITGLRTGDYQAVVTDANGCSVNVTATVAEPTTILLQAVEQPVRCNGDSNGGITLSANGGTPNYTYRWSNQQTTANLTGVSAANYCVTVTDAHGCQALTCMNVTTPQSVVITNTAVQNVTCFDANNGTIRVNVVGGTPNYTYNWSVPTSTNSSSITGLKPGNYSLNILDANGCKANQSFTITTPAPIQMTYTSTNLICYGDESGSISITQITGGTAPYKFSIDGTNFSANKVYTNLEASSYNLYARDLNGCTYTSPNITITQPSQIQVVLTATKDTIELGDATTINARISGRPSNLTFLWSPKDSLSCTTCERNIVATPSHTTSYRLTVQSDKGCTAHKDITIFVNKNRSVYIPTGFTPNNDGINDAFMVYSAKGIKSIKTFRVFDRWGELLFENNNSKPNEPTSGWDGVFKNKAMIPDVYIYLIEVEFVDGYNQIYKGAVNLIR
jgi:gliding motility-associated-like protein